MGMLNPSHETGFSGVKRENEFSLFSGRRAGLATLPLLYMMTIYVHTYSMH